MCGEIEVRTIIAEPLQRKRTGRLQGRVLVYRRGHLVVSEFVEAFTKWGARRSARRRERHYIYGRR